MHSEAEQGKPLPTTAEGKDGGSSSWLEPSPAQLGFVSRGLQALLAFQGMCLHFAKDVLEAIQVRKQAIYTDTWRTCRNRSPCFHSVNPSVFCSSSCIWPLSLLLWNPLVRLFMPFEHVMSKLKTNLDPVNKKSQQKHVS